MASVWLAKNAKSAKSAKDAMIGSGTLLGHHDDWELHACNRCVALLGVAGASAPDLALIVQAWPKLHEAVRAGIMAMVRANERSAD